MAGIIEMNMKTDPLKNVSGYQAEQIQIDEKKDTVEGRAAGIIARNSPLMQLAETRAKQGQNAKGTLNSSMAVQAGGAAVLDKAVEIAQPDAAMSYDAKKTNVGANNAASQFNAGSKNQIAGQQLVGQQAIEQIGAQGAEQRKNIGAQGEVESRLITERGQVEKDIQLAVQAGDIAGRERLMDRQGQIDRELQELRGQQNIEGIQAQGAINKDLQKLDQNFQFVMQELKGTQAKELEQMANENRLLIQSSQSASMLFSQISASMAEILAQPDIPADQKAALIAKQSAILQSGLTVIGAAADFDFSGLLDFSGLGNTTGTPTPGPRPATQPVQAPTGSGSDPITNSNPVANEIRDIRTRFQGTGAGAENRALEDMYQYFVDQGYTKQMAATALGVDVATVDRNLAKIGKTL